MNQSSAKKTNKIEIKIQGRSYLLRGQEDVGYLQQIATFVNQKIDEINELYSHLSTNDAAALTLINICDLYFKEAMKSKESKSEETGSKDDLLKEMEELRKENEKLRLNNEELGKNYIKLEREFNQFIEEFDRK